MNSTASVQNVVSEKKLEKKEQMKVQLASHLAGQPDNIRSFHRLMNVLESISFAIMIIVFITALVLSFMSKSIPVQAILTAWFLLPVSGSILSLLIGLHALVVHAFPPSGYLSVIQRGSFLRLPGKSQGFLTGKAAAFQSWGLIIMGLVAGAFFALFAWAAWTVNWAILTPMINVLGVLMGVGITVSILFTMFQKIFKSR